MATAQQTVLLVEDEAVIAMLEVKQLEKRGYRVLHALNGERAIELIASGAERVDLILMDINLGKGIDGTQAASIILSEHDIPLVFVSSHTEREIVEKTEGITSYGYVVKNTGETVLLASVKMAFKLHEAHRRLVEKDEALRQKTEEFDTLFSHTLDLLCIADEDGNFLRMSKEWENVLGYPLHELLGKSFFAFVHPEDLQSAYDSFARLNGQRNVINFVNRCRRRDGNYRWIEWRSFPAGKKIYTSARDITDRRLSEKRMLAWQDLMQYIIKYVPTAISVLDNDLRYIFVSERYLRDYGVKEKDIIGRHHYDVFPELPERLRAVHRRVLKGAVEHAEDDPFVRFDGSVDIVNWECRPWYNEDGAIGGIILYTEVITRQKDIEQNLLVSNKRLQSIVNALQYQARNLQDFLDHALEEAIQLTSSRVGYIYFYNEAERKFTLNTWSKDVLKECDISLPSIYYELDKTGFWGESVRQRKPLVLNDFQASHPLKKGYPEGHVRLSRFMTVPVMSGERIVAVVGVANKSSDYGQTDILQLTLLMESIWKVVERQQAVDDLIRSEERYKRLTENVEDIIYRYEFLPERRLTYISPSSTRITGFSPEEFYADPDLLRRLVHPDDRTFFEGLSEGKTAVQPIILRWVKKGDSIIWTEQRNVQIFDENGILIAIEGIARDITERKRMEEALTKEHERLSLIIKGANAGSWDWSVQTGDLIIDERWAEIAGYTLDELRPVSLATWDRLIHPDDVKVFEKALERHFSGEAKYYECEVRVRHKDGHWVWILDRGKVMEWSSDGKPERMFGTHSDISTLKQAEFALVDALDEKQTLLRELQHRIKNSMAMITSLVYLEADRNTDKNVRTALEDIGGRVSVLADLYGLLYEEGGDRIQLDRYIAKICDSLSATFSSYGEVQLSSAVDPVAFSSKQASSVGLIVNELITNAYKYAFPEGRKGNIRVGLSALDSDIILSISDDGVGLPSGYDPAASEGLGFKLVTMLTAQLGGTFSWDSGEGTRFRISIPAVPAER